MNGLVLVYSIFSRKTIPKIGLCLFTFALTVMKLAAFNYNLQRHCAELLNRCVRTGL